METQKQWLAVYTKPRWEKKVSMLLSKKNIENYCPINRVVRQWADRKKTIYEPLISCYVFVYVNPTEHLTIKKTDGILNFIYWLGKPAVIKYDEIIAMKNFLTAHEEVLLEKIDININDEVRIKEGPFSLKEGSVLEVRRNTVKVMLPTLGYALIAEVKRLNVEIINNHKTLLKIKQ